MNVKTQSKFQCLKGPCVLLRCSSDRLVSGKERRMANYSPDKTKQGLTYLALKYANSSPAFKFSVRVPFSNTCLILCDVCCGVVCLDLSAANIDPSFY